MIIEQIWPQWKVEKEIGRGSYGVVYKCCREENGEKKYAAIKVISLDPSQDDSFSSSLTGEQTKQFYQEVYEEILQEADLLRSLKGNKNIVEIKESATVETEDGWHLLIRMELLNSFERYISEHEIKERDVIKLGTDLCEALTACHEKGIIHRDIKPKNILVDKQGTFELSDFGVAKKLEGRGYASSLKGNFEFMAPEVIHEQKSDARSDVYSLGLVMYWLLNGRTLPFVPKDGITKYADYKKSFDKRMAGEPLPEIENVSKELNRVILKACQYKPENRYRSAEEFRQALSGDLPKPKPKQKLFIAIAAIVLVLTIGTIATVRYFDKQDSESNKYTLTVFPISYDPESLYLSDEIEYCDAYKDTVLYPNIVGSAYLYYGPAMYYFKSISELKNGTSVKVLSQPFDGWVLVKAKGHKGWIQQDYLSSASKEAAADTTVKSTTQSRIVTTTTQKRSSSTDDGTQNSYSIPQSSSEVDSSPDIETTPGSDLITDPVLPDESGQESNAQESEEPQNTTSSDSEKSMPSAAPSITAAPATQEPTTEAAAQPAAQADELV